MEMINMSKAEKFCETHIEGRMNFK